MKQVVQNYRTGELAVEELPPPALRPGGVLVQTAYSLISAGTERTIVETAQSSLVGKARERPDLVRQVFDTFKREGLKATYEKVRAKLNQIKPLGYSASGVVIAVGSDAGQFKAGDRVACAGAGYASHAEVIYVPKNLCVNVPDTVKLETACYTTVGAIAMQGIRQADARLGETVAVIGLGLVGQLTVQILKAAGCQVIGIDIDSTACELAKRSGADEVAADAAAARAIAARLTEGRGVDSVLVTAGTRSNEPVELAGELARDRARVVIVGLVGMNVPRHSFYLKELELKLSRSYGPGRYDPQYEEKGTDYPIGYVRWTEKRNMESFLRLAAAREIDTDLLTTHRFSVSKASEAYNLILGQGGQRYCGVVLEYPETDRAPVRHVAKPGGSQSRGELAVSFIGAGSFARGVLLPIVRRSPEIRLAQVATSTGISAKNTASQYGFLHSTTDAREVLDDDSQCIFIATRHDSHAWLAAEALRRGKTVFVEKPLATTLDGLRDVLAAALQSTGSLMVGYNRRFAPIAKEIKRRIGEGAGPKTILYRVNAGQLPADHWTLDVTEGGGRVIGEVCHFIDFVQFMTDSLPETVSAAKVAQSGGAFIDDSITISLSMADGSIASIVYTAGGDSSVAKEYVEVYAGRAVGVIEDFKTGYFAKAGKRTRLGGSSQDKGHASEIESFLDAARGRAEQPFSLESLAATSLACFAALEASANATAVRVDAASFIDRLGSSHYQEGE